GEGGQVRQLGDAERGADRLDRGKRIVQLARLDRLAEILDAQAVPAQRVHAPARQADDRVAPPVLATFDRFEQVGVWSVGELQVDRQRRVQVGQHLAHERNAGASGGGERV